MSLLLLLPAAVAAAGPGWTDASPAATVGPDLSPAFADAAEDHGVPEKLLLALAWEASHWRPGLTSAWGGYGLFDLREGGEGGPDVERAAMASGHGPDALMEDDEAQIDAVGALLAEHAARSHGGVLPPTGDLLAWWDAVRAFSGQHDPRSQERFAATVYEAINFGVDRDPATGLELIPEPVDHWNRVPVPPPTACDYGGCAQFVQAHSSNYTSGSRGSADIDVVVIHTVQGSYAGCISWFQNSSANVSAHYVVRSSDGEVTQMLSESDIGWHAGNRSYNERSVGIEHEGYVQEPGTWYTDTMYDSSAALTADIADRNGIPVDRSHIIGHVEVPGATHTDPGSGWDWSHYMDRVNHFSSGGSATGNLIGVVADTDIYDGERFVGATVWIEETGEVSETDGEGYYRFTELPLDSYTVHACMDGFAESTCSKSISTGDNWCSMALEPGSGCSLDDGGDDGGGTGGGTGGDTDGGTGGGTGGTVDVDPSGFERNAAGPPPGEAVALEETRGCASVGGMAGALGLSLWAVGFAAIRTRRDR